MHQSKNLEFLPMPPTQKKPKPLHAEHRKRIKERFIKEGLRSFRDYEALEILLTYAIHQKDVKPVAKKLLQRFKTFHAVLEAPIEDLTSIDGIGEHSAILLKLVKECSDFYLKEKIIERDIVSSPHDLLNYYKSSIACLENEEFRVLYLNAKNEIIHEEIEQKGTVDQTAVYPRKIMKNALKKKAVSLIFVHNHPSGDPKPSRNDHQLTQALIKAAKTLEIRVHDHVIIGKNGYYSFNEEGHI
jgi:DNA repair protein RadC